MALKEQDIVFTGKDSSGNTIIQMPITRAANVEDLTSTCLPLAGGTMTGEIVASSGYFARQGVDTGALIARGGTDSTSANIALYGKNHTSNKGWFSLQANDGTNNKYLIGKPDGALLWGGNNVLTDKLSGAKSIVNTSESGSLQIYGGTAYETGSLIGLYGKSHASRPGWLYLSAHDGTNSHVLIGKPDGTLTWGGKSLVGGVPAVSGASVSVNATPTDGTAYQYTMPNDGLVELSCRAGVGRSYHYEYGGDTGSGNDSEWYENEGNTIMSVKVGDVFVYPSKTVTKDSQSYSGIFFAKKGQKIEVLCDRTTTTSSYIKYAIAHSFSVTVHPH